MTVPADLRYTSDHEWVAVRGSGPVTTVRIGITDYAQSALGDVVYVQVPSVGTAVSTGDTFSEVESTKSVSDIYAPVTGTITQVNDALGNAPEILNADPYGDGWLCEIELADSGELDGLLDASAYQALIEG
jgi:glycine cleavage system H protein